MTIMLLSGCCFFFFDDTATPEIYPYFHPLSLHDALPISRLDSPSMTAGGAPIKARGCPPIFFENRLPPRPLRGASACAPAALTDAPPPVRQTPFSMVDRKSTRLNSSH